MGGRLLGLCEGATHVLRLSVLGLSEVSGMETGLSPAGETDQSSTGKEQEMRRLCFQNLQRKLKPWGSLLVEEETWNCLSTE